MAARSSQPAAIAWTGSPQDRQALDLLSRSLDKEQLKSVQGGKKIDQEQTRRVESFLLE